MERTHERRPATTDTSPSSVRGPASAPSRPDRTGILGLQRRVGNHATVALLGSGPLQRKQFTEGSQQAPFQVTPGARAHAKWVIGKKLNLAANLAGSSVGKISFFVVAGASPGTIGYEKFKNQTWCGGRQYQNKDKQLPGSAVYTEWDVQAYEAGNRGTDRVVVSDAGRSFYSNDHYANFVEIVK